MYYAKKPKYTLQGKWMHWFFHSYFYRRNNNHSSEQRIIFCKTFNEFQRKPFHQEYEQKIYRIKSTRVHEIFSMEIFLRQNLAYSSLRSLPKKEVEGMLKKNLKKVCRCPGQRFLNSFQYFFILIMVFHLASMAEKSSLTAKSVKICSQAIYI